MVDYLTFADITTEVQRAVKATKGSIEGLIHHVINMVYLNEMLMADDLYPLYWMVDFDDSLASVAPATISGITIADPGVITTAAAHGFVAGDIVSIYNIVGTTQLNNRMFKVGTTPLSTTLTLIDFDGIDAISTAAMTAWSSGGTIHHRGLTLATTGKNVQNIIACKWHNESALDPIDITEIEALNSNTNDSTSRPSRYLHRKSFYTTSEFNQLIWFQGADAAYDLRYWFEKRASKLTGTDVPLLPPQLQYGLVAGSVMRLSQSGVEVETPLVWPTVYKAQLAALLTFNRKFYEKNDLYRIQNSVPYLL